MTADWTTSPTGSRVLQHNADPRPAWLWSQDGNQLLWHNDAAELFLAKLKKSGLKLAAPAVPIKGQVARNIRLGSPGRTSLARIQFLAGSKPTSSTCATTPLHWRDGQMALLIVGVDPIDSDVRAAAMPEPDEAVSEAPDIAEPSDVAPEEAKAEAPTAEPSVEPTAEPVVESIAAQSVELTTEPSVEPSTGLPAAPTVEPADDSFEELAEALVEAAAWADPESIDPDETRPEAPYESIAEAIAADEHAYERELDNWRAVDQEQVYASALAEEAEAEGESKDEPEAEVAAAAEEEPVTIQSLSDLIDRLAADSALFTPLTDADDLLLSAGADEADANAAQIDIDGDGFVFAADEPDENTDAEADLDDLARLDGIDSERLSAMAEIAAAAPRQSEDATDQSEPNQDAEAAEVAVRQMEAALAALGPIVARADTAPPPDAERVERVSRYNFDELSRILTDRVGDPAQQQREPVPSQPAPMPATSGALINLGGETLVLNRLPLGIMVFRDQHVLFANRAITEMVGYDSVEQLRNAGLASVFPATGPDGQEAGPINHLVQRDGTLVPVTARLQSMSWQGRPALMLSASTTEVRTGHEAAVRAFAEGLADMRGDGFFEANRAGTLSGINGRAGKALGMDEGVLNGKPLSNIIVPADLPALREFLERPARFAETARPCITLRGVGRGADIMIFAQGQAGVLTGYFGFVNARAPAAPLQISGGADSDPALLARVSRGVRRPLNTIIGFSDLIRSSSFGALGNERYETYAQDITTAGHEIAALVDELDDYTRLRDGRYLPQRASIDLTGLLESCVVRIRHQAASSRVIVRNAISEFLPRVTADRASLAQAVLNLLASAIDQTPAGGAVVISAQREDDGGIAIHVRDSSTNPVDMAERFVVFRDGVGRDGQMLAPVRSSVGLALTRSLLAVNAFSLSVDPAGNHGMLFSLVIPADLVDRA